MDTAVQQLLGAQHMHAAASAVLQQARRERCIAALRAHTSGLSFQAIADLLGASKNTAVWLVHSGERYLAEDGTR
mgnify:CR=1 FL=1